MKNKQIQSVPEPPYPDPPAHLSERAAALWRTVGPTHAKTLARRELLTECLAALDRADEARAIVSKEGMTSTSASGVVHAHPAVKIEREFRQQFARLADQLGIAEVILGWTAGLQN